MQGVIDFFVCAVKAARCRPGPGYSSDAATTTLPVLPSTFLLFTSLLCFPASPCSFRLSLTLGLPRSHTEEPSLLGRGVQDGVR